MLFKAVGRSKGKEPQHAGQEAKRTLGRCRIALELGKKPSVHFQILLALSSLLVDSDGEGQLMLPTHGGTCSWGRNDWAGCLAPTLAHQTAPHLDRIGPGVTDHQSPGPSWSAPAASALPQKHALLQATASSCPGAWPASIQLSRLPWTPGEFTWDEAPPPGGECTHAVDSRGTSLMGRTS